MRPLLSLLALSFSLLLAACSGGTIEQASPNPAGVEPVPSAQDPIGTESGGAAKEVSAITWTHFGTEPTLTDSVKLRDFLDAPAGHVGKQILVEGNVVDVCQKAGCWLVMSDGDRQLRVTMKDHGFAVDKQGAGSWARIQGLVQEIPLDPDTTAHFEGESARPDLLPEKQGQKFQIHASGVSLQDKGDEAPAEAATQG
jgi:hypothetical protein